MLKLLVTLGAFLLVALTVLGLRMHRLEVTAETARLHNDLLLRQQQVWDQQRDIAANTNPVKLAEKLRDSGLDFGGPVPVMRTNRGTGPTTQRARGR